MERDHGPPAEGAASFHTTRWTIVMKAAQSQAQGGPPALADHRLRKRYTALLREAVGRTVSDPSNYFYAMEFVEGETLDSLIKRSGRLEVKLALEIATQVAAGLAAVHKQKLVHRDIKPGNIMVSLEEGGAVTAKIIDLGLARAVNEPDSQTAISMPGGFVGTPDFASPEQFAGVQVDTRSDIYSLGATLWKMLTGRTPYQGTSAELMYQHLHAPLAIEKLDHVPQPVVVLIEVLLEKDPGRRFQNPTELLKAMAAITGAIDAGRRITRQNLQQTPSTASRVETRKRPTRLGPKKISISRLPITGSDLFGREDDIAFLDDAWANQQVNVVTIVAWGGVGKSTLVNTGLCVITTRTPIADIADYERSSTQRRSLEHLSSDAGAQLLRALGVNGHEAELRSASDEFRGHCLALTLLGSYLTDACHGDIRYREEVSARLAHDLRQGAHARKVMESYQSWLGEGAELAILRMLGLFDRPADEQTFDVLLKSPAIAGLTESLTDLRSTEWQTILAKLRRARLLAREDPHNPGQLDTHPLVREYFGEQLRTQQAEAWKECNRRLYHYYQTLAPQLPNNFREMEPLFSAVVCGCNAGLYREALHEVYIPRIQRSDASFAANILAVRVALVPF